MITWMLASQFNSFMQPLIVMTAQPLAIIGGVFGLWLPNYSLNICSMIGMVLLVGLVAKSSILLVDLTNQLRRQGKEINAALLQACPIRMRPVLMTSLMVVISMLPAVLGIGGMLSSTLLTLIVVPVVYSLVEHGIIHLRGLFNKPS